MRLPGVPGALPPQPRHDVDQLEQLRPGPVLRGGRTPLARLVRHSGLPGIVMLLSRQLLQGLAAGAAA
jgi:hypothetical protein